MLVTVSTVKDTLANTQRFVAGNLAGGADHLVLCLDAPGAEGQREIEDWLSQRPHVTCLRSGKAWWDGDRPGQLNVRQRINANAIKHVLAHVPGIEWLVHLDGDEIVLVDREVLASVPASTPAVQLKPLEAVSRKQWDGDPTWFKRLLDDADLALLFTLGVIPKPTNYAYFHGHVDGKAAIRPAADGWLTLHKAVDDEREPLPVFEHPSLRHVHYESYSGADFVRKWSTMAGSGPSASFRAARGETMTAVRSLLDKALPTETLEPLLLKVFERTTEDDFETLRELGMLEQIDPLQGAHQPTALTADQRAAFDAALAGIAGPKRHFHPAQGAKLKAARSR